MNGNFDEYKSGLNYFKQNDYTNAIDSFLKAKIKNPNQFDVYFYLGESYSKTKDFRKALQAYTVGLLISPNDVEIKTALAQIAPNYTSSDKEEEDLRKEILLHPEDLGNYLGLADTLLCKYDNSSLGEAIELLETIIQLFPQKTAAYMLLSIGYDDKGMIDEGIEICEKAVRIDPDFYEIDNMFLRLDNQYKLKGNFTKMIKKYQTLLRNEKNKHDISYHFALAESYLNNGDLLSAKEEFHFIINKHLHLNKSQFIGGKLKEIDEKLKRIKSIHEKVNQFDRKMRKFIERIFLKNNREICEKIEKSELFDKIQGIIQTEINKKPYLKKDGLNPLDYFTIYDYNKLIEINWDIFDKIFLSRKN